MFAWLKGVFGAKQFLSLKHLMLAKAQYNFRWINYLFCVYRIRKMFPWYSNLDILHFLYVAIYWHVIHCFFMHNSFDVKSTIINVHFIFSSRALSITQGKEILYVSLITSLLHNTILIVSISLKQYLLGGNSPVFSITLTQWALFVTA